MFLSMTLFLKLSSISCSNYSVGLSLQLYVACIDVTLGNVKFIDKHMTVWSSMPPVISRSMPILSDR